MVKLAVSDFSLICTERHGSQGDRPQHNHQLKVGIHSLGYVAERTKEAVEDFYPGYARSMNKIGKERGWHRITRTAFDAQRGPEGALLVGDPEEIAEKIIRHSKSLGGISRITFMMNASTLSHEKIIQAIKLIGSGVAPALRKEIS